MWLGTYGDHALADIKGYIRVLPHTALIMFPFPTSHDSFIRLKSVGDGQPTGYRRLRSDSSRRAEKGGRKEAACVLEASEDLVHE